MTSKTVKVGTYVKKTGRAVDVHVRKNPRVSAKKVEYESLKPKPWDADSLDVNGESFDPEKGEGWVVNSEGKRFWVGPGADLERRNLSGLDLRKANLQKANLRRANLSFAELEGANLSEIDGWGADFRGASLRYVNLSKSILTKANFVEVVMRNVLFRDATANQINFSIGVFDNVDFSNSDLREATCESASFINVDFTDSEIDNVSFKQSRMQSILKPGTAREVDFSAANISGSDLSDTKWIKVRLGKTNATNINLSNSVLEDVSFGYVDFSGSIFENTDCGNAKFAACDLRGIYWGGAKTRHMTIGAGGSGRLLVPLSQVDTPSFADAAKQMNVSLKQLEYLVVSKAIEVRDRNGKIVTSNFDEKNHYIPQWAIDNYIYYDSES